MLRKATFFFALTGLPFKEMQNLEWQHITVSVTDGIYIDMKRQKTDKPYEVNISQQAYQLLGEPKSPKEKVFDGLSNHERYELFQLWLAKAGITKKLTFHDLRHTYGTNQIDAGTDIYTVKGNMAHTDVRYTQRYSKESKRRKMAASEAIQLDL